MRFDVRARAEEVGTARHTITAFLVDQGVPSPIVADLELVVSELVTNAILHGRGGPVHLEAVAARDVVLAVQSKSSPGSIPPIDDWTLPAPDAARGRGLAIVQRLCDEVELRDHDRGAVVVCRRRLPDGGTQ